MTALIALGAFVLITLASARVTRAFVFDDFPPTMKIRDWWDGKTIGSAWNSLFHCPFCLGIWVALPATVLAVGFLFGWGTFADPAGIFWALAGWFAVGYVSSMLVASDFG